VKIGLTNNSWLLSLISSLYNLLQLPTNSRISRRVSHNSVGQWGLHQSLDLTISPNIVLLFQPPYSPQVNPIERFWKKLKRKLRWKLFENLDELRERLSKELNKLTPELIHSVSGWQFIREALSVANI
jgi:putative transposase